MQESIQLQLNEEMLSIQDYEGLYSITSKGRVLSHEKIRRGKNNSQRAYKVKFLKLDLDKYGYSKVRLYKDSKNKKHLVHRLEAIVFIENPQNLPEVNHKDGNKLNNYVDNLEWCTHEDNMKHASENGLFTFKHHSEFYGVSYHKGKGHENKPWFAQIRLNKKLICVGFYKAELEAAIAYNSFVVKNKLDRPLNEI